MDASATHLNHDLWAVRHGGTNRGGGNQDRSIICRICGAQWPATEMDKAEEAECKGSPAGRAEAFLTKDESAVWKRGGISLTSLRTMGAMRIRPHTIPGEMEGVEDLRRNASGVQGEGLQAERNQREEMSGAGRRFSGEVEATPAHAAMGHRLTTTGPILWCIKCVSFAHFRHGAAFKAPCTGYSDLGSRRARRQRLAQGKHPITDGRL